MSTTLSATIIFCICFSEEKPESLIFFWVSVRRNHLRKCVTGVTSYPFFSPPYMLLLKQLVLIIYPSLSLLHVLFISFSSFFLQMSSKLAEDIINDWPQHGSSIELDAMTDNEQKPINRTEEIELVHRLDKRLLVFAMFGNLVKALDNTNLGNTKQHN